VGSLDFDGLTIDAARRSVLRQGVAVELTGTEFELLVLLAGAATISLGLLAVELRPDDEIVEVGCGVGRITRELARRGRSVRALDVSAEMLERAEIQAPYQNVRPGDDTIEELTGRMPTAAELTA
jgi:2-polyprenyl-3-methyl-5-hydroxy-6-metoxy-1,4-benzoquinol methylase